MNNILIFKTSSENVLIKLFEDLKDIKGKKYCLIQSSLIKIFQKKYADIEFLDIQQEGFYNVSQDIMSSIKQKYFDKVYIPATGPRPTNFGNILKIVNDLDCGEIVFYNCSGEEKTVKRKSKLEEKFIRGYIKLVQFFYR